MKNNLNSSSFNKGRNNTNQNNKNKMQNKSKNRFLITFICIFMSVVLVFGGTLLTVTLVRQASYSVKYDGSGMDTRTASYFAGYYKYQYLGLLKRAGVNAYDAESFWASSPKDSDKTYGELLEDGTENFIKQTLVASVLYDRYSSLSNSDKSKIDDAVSRRLDQLGINDARQEFDAKTDELGFDYTAYKKAVEIFYKAANVRPLLGELLLEVFPDAYDEHLEKYSHVRLMFVDGKYKIKDGELTELTEQEKDAYESDISNFRTLIANKTASEDTFEYYFEKYNRIANGTANGEYYLEQGESFTQGFRDGAEEVVDRILDIKLENGEVFSELETDNGIWFIYKTSPDAGAYDNKSFEMFFENFKANVSEALYDELILMYAEDAIITEKFSEIDIITLPFSYEYFITEF